MNQVLTNWNAMNTDDAARAILPCCGSEAWAMGLVAQRPLASEEDLFAISDDVWLALPEKDWVQAFESHPRIGQGHAKAATAESLKWSEQEQSKATPDEMAKAALKDGNALYEERFGRIFIVCATGKTAAEMLAILETRLKNDDATEMREAAEQQRQITQLRLRKWLAGIA